MVEELNPIADSETKNDTNSNMNFNGRINNNQINIHKPSPNLKKFKK